MFAHAHWPHGLRRSHSANGVKCVYAAQVPKAPPPWLPACQLSRLKRRPKENNKLCSTSRKTKNKKKGRKIKERQKTKNSRNILKRRARNCESSRAAEQRSVLEINTQLKPFADGHAPTPTARTWHICCRPIDAACSVVRWHGELSWTELWLSWIYGRRRTKVGNENCLK